MQGGGNVQKFRFSSNAISQRDRVEMFREWFGRTILKIDIEPFRERMLDVDMTLHGLPGFGMASGRLSPMRNHHRASRADHDDFVLVVLQAGRGELSQAGRQASVHNGQAVLTANGESGTFVGTTATKLANLRLSRQRLSAGLTDLDASLVKPIPHDHPILRLLVAYAGVVSDLNALSSPETCEATVTHLHDLATLLLGATRDAGVVAAGRGLRAARLRDIKAEVLRTLDRPDLSVNEIAASHRISARYVQRLFESEGTTFSEFVLSARLDRALDMLTSCFHADRAVSAIALASGFSDLSYFNRAFRRRYGDTPTGVRRGSGKDM